MDPSQLPPNYDESRKPLVIGISVWLMSICVVMVGLRVWTRKFIINQFGLDDWFAIFTLLITLGEGVAICVNTRFGLGQHVWMMELQNIPLYLRCFYVSIVLYTASLLFVKLTLLFQYYRLMAVQKLQRVYIAAILIVGGWGISQVFVGIFLCNPVEGFWDSTVKATCIPNYPQFYINAAGNIVTDIAVLLLPLPVLSHLKLPKQQKIILLGIFSLGFFTVAISVIRIRFLKIFDDFPWENVEPQLWSIGELTSALTCACLPTLRPLASRFFPSLKSRAGRSSRGYARTGESGGPRSKDIESARATTNASTESRDHLYDDDKQEGQSYELRHQDSGDISENIVGLKSTREGLSNAHNAAEATPYNRDEQTLGLRPTIRTEITPTRTESKRMSSQNAIQVQRDVYQTKSRQ